MSNKKLLRYDSKFLTTQEDKLLSGNPHAVGQGLGESKHFIMRNNKLLFNGGHPLVFSDTVSPVMNENSWATIKAVVQAGRALDFWDYGDYKVCHRYERDKYGVSTGVIRPFRFHLAGTYDEQQLGLSVIHRAVFCSNIDMNAITEIIDYEDYVTLAKPQEYQHGEEIDEYISGGLCSYFGTRLNTLQSVALASQSFDTVGVISQSLIKRWLDGELTNIIDAPSSNDVLSVQKTVHSEIWEDNYQSGFQPIRGISALNGMYTESGKLHIPSPYEVTGNSNYREIKLAKDYFSQYNTEELTTFSNVEYIGGQSSYVYEGTALQLFQNPSKAARLLDGEIASASSAYFMLRTPHDRAKFYRLWITDKPSVSVHKVDSTSAGSFLYTMVI